MPRNQGTTQPHWNQRDGSGRYSRGRGRGRGHNRAWGGFPWEIGAGPVRFRSSLGDLHGMNGEAHGDLNSNIYRMGGGLYDVFGAVRIPHRFRLPIDSGNAFITLPFLVFHVGHT